MDKEYIEELLKKDIKTLGYDIWGIELLGSSLKPTLRIFIDNENGTNAPRHIPRAFPCAT